MAKGKFLNKGKYEYTGHRCRPPINWFMVRYGVGAKWQCECGDVWEYKITMWTEIGGPEYEWVPDKEKTLATRVKRNRPAGSAGQSRSND